MKEERNMPETTAKPFDVAAARAHYKTLDEAGQVAFARSLTHKQYSAIVGQEIAENLNARSTEKPRKSS